jgi:hypothetical protein
MRCPEYLSPSVSATALTAVRIATPCCVCRWLCGADIFLLKKFAVAVCYEERRQRVQRDVRKVILYQKCLLEQA